MRPPGTLLTLNCNSNFPAFLSLSNQEKVVSDFSVLTPQSEAILTFDGWTTAPKVCWAAAVCQVLSHKGAGRLPPVVSQPLRKAHLANESTKQHQEPGAWELDLFFFLFSVMRSISQAGFHHWSVREQQGTMERLNIP